MIQIRSYLGESVDGKAGEVELLPFHILISMHLNQCCIYIFHPLHSTAAPKAKTDFPNRGRAGVCVKQHSCPLSFRVASLFSIKNDRDGPQCRGRREEGGRATRYTHMLHASNFLLPIRPALSPVKLHDHNRQTERETDRPSTSI